MKNTIYGFLLLQQNSTYPDAGYSDRLGPLGKHFLTVNVLHLLMALIPPPPSQSSNTFLELCIKVSSTECTYLGTKIDQLGDNTTEIKYRISQTRKAINALNSI